MWILRTALFGIYLLILSVVDLKKRKFPLWVLLLGIAAAIFLGVFEKGTEYFNNQDLWLGVICGIFFLAVSWLTHEKFGFADSIVILGVFLSVGYERGMVCVTIAFFIAGAAALLLLIRRKAGRNTELPFLPYLFAGYITGVILGR